MTTPIYEIRCLMTPEQRRLSRSHCPPWPVAGVVDVVDREGDRDVVRAGAAVRAVAVGVVGLAADAGGARDRTGTTEDLARI